MRKIILYIILLLVVIFLYGRFIESRQVIVNEYVINKDNVPTSFKDLKIVHFSDILYDKDEKRLDKIVDKINKENADIVIFTGDLFNKNIDYNTTDFEKLQTSLNNINASLYKFAIMGENDQKYIEQYKDMLYESDFELLDNKNKLLFFKDITPINIIGITDMSKIDELLITDEECKYNLVITHEPDNFKILKEKNIDLVLSGHSLGGIVNIPFYGGLIKTDGAKKYINSHYLEGSSELFISNGLGYFNFNFRLFNTPSINVYRFKK